MSFKITIDTVKKQNGKTVHTPVLVTIDTIKNTAMFKAPLRIDGDGGARTYNPQDTGRDALEDAKDGDEWVGIVTVDGQPYVHPDGFYVSTTTYQDDQYAVTDRRRYLDSEEIPFIVLPPQVIESLPPEFLGCYCETWLNGKMVPAVMGDVGPHHWIGEGSEFLAKCHGLNPSPRNGGLDTPDMDFTVFAGRPASINGRTFKLQHYKH